MSEGTDAGVDRERLGELARGNTTVGPMDNPPDTSWVRTTRTAHILTLLDQYEYELTDVRVLTPDDIGETGAYWIDPSQVGERFTPSTTTRRTPAEGEIELVVGIDGMVPYDVDEAAEVLRSWGVEPTDVVHF